MNQVTKDYIRQWLLKAEEDLLVVDRLTDGQMIATSNLFSLSASC